MSPKAAIVPEAAGGGGASPALRLPGKSWPSRAPSLSEFVFYRTISVTFVLAYEQANDVGEETYCNFDQWNA